MLSVFAQMFSIATKQQSWDAPPHWTGRKRRPISDSEARRIDQERRARLFRTLW